MTTTGSNIKMLEEAAGLCAWDSCQEKLRNAIRMKEMTVVEDSDQWRIPYLSKLLGQRQELGYMGEELEKTRKDDLINSLCIH